MELGMFLMPTHPPERSLYDATQWDLQVIRWADELGYSSAWIGEHFTSPWEPIPSPDLLIAQAILQTKQIKLAPGAHLLPYHHPVELAHRVAYLDHLAQGRFILGIGSSGLPSDWALFNVDGVNGENRKMTAEAMEIMLNLWDKERGPEEYRGQYWNYNTFDEMFDGLSKIHIYPYQEPHPPIGIAGMSPSSETLKLAGEKGFIPLSFGSNQEYLASHWNSVVEGAERTGRETNRKDWMIVKEVFVADTDEEALELSANSAMGRFYDEYWIPLMTQFGLLENLKHHPGVADEELTPEYAAKNVWFVGSPDTVAQKIVNLYETTGGFGTLMAHSYDYSENPEPWKKSLKLLKEEVLPRVERIIGQQIMTK
ncbi:alkane 1-monooxygenase [Alkalihalophilus pseudofirmus]|nr:alkane 1-monooxygenase [Alkalihalophilus pseudofirmus]